MTLQTYLDAQATARQLTVDEYLALDRDGDPLEASAAAGIMAIEDTIVSIEDPNSGTEPHDGCEFEPLCQQELAEKRKPGAKPPTHPYRCGWLATNIEWCPKRGHLKRR